MTNRMNHTGCTHPATPKGRATCRTGNELVGSARKGDMVQCGTGGGFVITGLSIVGYGLPRSIRIAGGGVDFGWIESHQVTGYERRA